METALREADRGIIEATQSMGASTRQIITHALLPEARPGIFAAITVTAITLVSYTAMAGVVGAGGLGDLAIRFGYQRFQTDVMVVTVVMLLILVQILQTVGDKLVVHFLENIAPIAGHAPIDTRTRSLLDEKTTGCFRRRCPRFPPTPPRPLPSPRRRCPTQKFWSSLNPRSPKKAWT